VVSESLEDERKRWKQFDVLREEERKEKILKIVELAKKKCPIDYKTFVHTVFIELGVGYSQNQKRGVYSKEVDSLIAMGLLKRLDDGTVTLGE
jgi:hypothetical protein